MQKVKLYVLLALILPYMCGCAGQFSREGAAAQGSMGKNIQEAFQTFGRPVMAFPVLMPSDKHYGQNMYVFERLGTAHTYQKPAGSAFDTSSGQPTIIHYYQLQTDQASCAVTLWAGKGNIIDDYIVDGCGHGKPSLMNKESDSLNSAQPTQPEQREQQAEAAAMQMPAYAQVVATEAEATKAASDPDGQIAYMVQVTDLDRYSVKNNMAPASILLYDTELLRMLMKNPASLAEHEHDSAWMKRKQALLDSKDAALRSYAPTKM